jgi:hypothetical protein
MITIWLLRRHVEAGGGGIPVRCEIECLFDFTGPESPSASTVSGCLTVRPWEMTGCSV